MNTFAHLHVYTGFTNPEGVCDIRDLVEKARENGMEALAITDKNVMFGVPDFIRTCERYNLKPIVGCEVTVGTADEHSPLVLLCEDMTGYKNLVRLVSDAWLQSAGGTPIVPLQALKKRSDGLIALSAGPEGEIAKALLSGEREKAVRAAVFYRCVFGPDGFYIELQDHGLQKEKELLPLLLELAKDTKLQTVATNAVHYVDKEDAELQKIRACIALGLSEQEYAGKGHQTDEYYLKSEEEMIKRFYGYEDAVTNAGKIAERCACPDLFRWFSVPPFRTPNGEHAGKYFRELCLNGLKERMGGVIPPEYKQRLEEEILYIRKMGYADYFLLIWDVVRYAKSVEITVGPGRGAATGCLALFACGVTEVDPIKHGLLFERFMNPERIALPDLDIDVAPRDRSALVRYLEEKYGEGRVFSVCSLRTGCFEICGYKTAILTDESVELIPLIRNEDGVGITQYERLGLERFGALDVNLLPLNVLGALDTAVKLIREKEPDFRLDAIDLKDKETFDMLCRGDSKSVFSFDSENWRNLLEESFPDSMADLAALYALDRPGTEDFIRKYLEAKLHPETVTYRTPELEPILKETGGGILYQEQVMEILHTLAGYSMAHTDFARRAFAKRMPEVLKQQREVFVYGSNEKDGLPACDGCLKRGIDEETANAVFDDIEKYCPYAFCKSHAVAYTLLAYRTAYLKCHYPEEWEAAVEKNEADEDDF